VTFKQSTSAYEGWLATQLEIVPVDVRAKHKAMKEEIFSFLRATFYRWAQLWPTLCGDLSTAPSVLAVGDLHVENFGTWRDVEGRLVWGINDFDEAENMPYTVDLTRLAASVHLAIETNHLNIGHREACTAILAGYREGLEAGGRPWVLGEKHVWLSELVALKDPPAFWDKLQLLPDHDGKIPKAARRGIEKMLPEENLLYRVARRQAGLGSLGRQRFVAIAEYGGAHICREAKALAPSAWFWAQGGLGDDRLCGERALKRAVRVPDPFVRIKDGWIVRRLAPDCIKIELVSVPRDKDKTKLLQAMGWETANVHVGSKNARAILADLGKRDGHWLHDAAERMIQATKADWKEWGGKVKRR
jgi:hypothetical protein